LNKWSKEKDFYLKLAGDIPKHILDAGCGTGMLAVKYAEIGHEVVGIDPESKMIEVAISRENSKLVEWHVSSLQTFKSTRPFDLIVMTGHAFQCLITDRDISEAFNSVFHLLTQNGCFVFNSRNPEVCLWKNWTPEKSKTNNSTPDGLSFEVYYNVLNVDGEKVTFEEHYNLEGKSESIISRSILRFAPLTRIEKLATAEGLVVDTVFGDWDSSVLKTESPEIIITLRRN
jgi:ubiquinone/menaquinone biosynthesis C-methylase UbiE